MDRRPYRQSRQNKDLTDTTIFLLHAAADRSEPNFDGPGLTRLIAILCDGNCKVLKTNNLASHLSPMDGRLYRQSLQNMDFTGATIFSRESVGGFTIAFSRWRRTIPALTIHSRAGKFAAVHSANCHAELSRQSSADKQTSARWSRT